MNEHIIEPSAETASSVAAPRTRDPLTVIRVVALGLVVSVVVGLAVLTLGRLAPGRGAAAASGHETSALAVVAGDLVNSAKHDGGAADAVGGYLPGTGIVLTVHHDRMPESETAAWVAAHLDPFAEQLGILPEGEAVVVTIDVAGPTPDARIWTFMPSTSSGIEGWDQLVAPATFVDSLGSVAVSEVADPVEMEVAAAPGAEDQLAPVADPAAVAVEQGIEEVPVAAGAGGPLLDASLWNPLFGSWTLADGVYSQSDATGYGYSSEFLGTVPTSYDVGVSMRASSGDLNGGLIYGMPEAGTKNGATIIDITGENTYLRWGRYDDITGEWQFVGGAPIEPALDPAEWHRLELEVRPDRTGILLDGAEVATIDPVAPGGVALVVSVAQVEFSEFTLEDADPSASPTEAPIADSAIEPRADGGGESAVEGSAADPVANAAFVDASLSQWQALSGMWSPADDILGQGNADAFDQMIHLRSGSLQNYRVEVSARSKDGSSFTGGLLFNVSTLGARTNSHVFDLTDDGQVARWAAYDANGVYTYLGGLAVELENGPREWNTLAVEVVEGRATFFVNDVEIGASVDVGSEGHVGLVTSKAAMDFRDFTVQELPTGSG